MDPLHLFDRNQFTAEVLAVLRETNMTNYAGAVADTIEVIAIRYVQQAVGRELKVMADEYLDEASSSVIWSALSRRARELTNDDPEQAPRLEFPEVEQKIFNQESS